MRPELEQSNRGATAVGLWGVSVAGVLLAFDSNFGGLGLAMSLGGVSVCSVRLVALAVGDGWRGFGEYAFSLVVWGG